MHKHRARIWGKTGDRGGFGFIFEGFQPSRQDLQQTCKYTLSEIISVVKKTNSSGLKKTNDKKIDSCQKVRGKPLGINYI